MWDICFAWTRIRRGTDRPRRLVPCGRSGRPARPGTLTLVLLQIVPSLGTLGLRQGRPAVSRRFGTRTPRLNGRLDGLWAKSRPASPLVHRNARLLLDSLTGGRGGGAKRTQLVLSTLPHPKRSVGAPRVRERVRSSLIRLPDISLCRPHGHSGCLFPPSRFHHTNFSDATSTKSTVRY